MFLDGITQIRMIERTKSAESALIIGIYTVFHRLVKIYFGLFVFFMISPFFDSVRKVKRKYAFCTKSL